jgi:hypothetical protein
MNGDGSGDVHIITAPDQVSADSFDGLPHCTVEISADDILNMADRIREQRNPGRE